jgi:hypothetical protein
MTFPPILYWSATLAECHPDGPDTMFAGLVDATSSILWTWGEGQWVIIGELPGDARRLVVDVAASDA